LFLIMRKTTRYARTSAVTAIAAALALSSTPLLAQQAQPTTTDPAPAVTAQPAPSIEAPPATTDTTVTPPTTSDRSASTTNRTTSKRTTRTVARTAAPAATKTVARTTTTRVAHATVPAAAARVAPVPAPTPATGPAAGPAKPAPIVDLNAKPATTAAPAKARPANWTSNPTLVFGGGALALLVLGVIAWALIRRRREEEPLVNEEMHEDWMEDEPPAAVPVAEATPMPRHGSVHAEQPAMTAPASSAFAWGNSQPCDEPSDDGSDRCPGESWVERAYRGPSPANPSVSLKARLRRAAFFDKRERDVAEGKAEPVEPDAGLPETMVEEQERELA